MWIALDTATDRAALAVGGPGGVLAMDTLVGARGHARALPGALTGCLERAGLELAGIEGIMVADGPGSFTGLRVAAAFVKGLLHARPVPLWTASSLMGLAAAAAPGPEDVVLAVSDALRGELFAAAYRFPGGRVETILAPVVLPEGTVREQVPAARVTGPAAARLGGTAAWPDAGALLGLVGLAGGARLVEQPAAWEPEYGRPAEAVVQWERTHGRPLADPARHHG